MRKQTGKEERESHELKDKAEDGAAATMKEAALKKTFAVGPMSGVLLAGS